MSKPTPSAKRTPPTRRSMEAQARAAARARAEARAQAQIPALKSRWQLYAELMRVDKPVGTLLLLWPTLWALWLAAEGFPNPRVLLIFCIGVVLMRSAGCIINDYADRWLDPLVKRTRDRPLASGALGAGEALALFAAIMLVAFLLVLLTNPLTVMLSVIGALLAITYPFMKRYTYFPQVVLGAAFGWSVPMAFAAQTGSVPQLAWLLFMVNVLWSTAYDTQYAMVDRDDDLKVGSRSTAILFGDLDRLFIGILQGSFLIGMFLVGKQAGLGLVYTASLLLAAALCVWQQWLIRERQRDACFQAFLNNSWVGAMLFAGILFDYILRYAD